MRAIFHLPVTERNKVSCQKKERHYQENQFPAIEALVWILTAR